MARAIAEKHGLRATFMPKPFMNLTGNGCHAHISVWDKTGKVNAFYDANDEMGLSPAGIQLPRWHDAPRGSLAAIMNPTVNSYKRINAPRTASGATWAPNSVTWTGNNRTHRFAFRARAASRSGCRNGATNPYLLQAVIVAAGLSGINKSADRASVSTSICIRMGIW